MICFFLIMASTVYIRLAQIFFCKNTSNSAWDLGPKDECIPIFIKFGPCLTTSLKPSRSLMVWLELVLFLNLQSIGDVVKLGQSSIKIGVHLNFGPRSPVEFEAFIKKNWTGLLWNQLNCFRNEISRIFWLEQFFLIKVHKLTCKGQVGLGLDGKGRWRANTGCNLHSDVMGRSNATSIKIWGCPCKSWPP